MRFVVGAFIYIILTAGCSNSRKEFQVKLAHLQSKEILIPDSLKVMRNGSFQGYLTDWFKKDESAIVVKIDADCYACIGDLREWKKFINDANTDVQYVFFIKSENYREYELYSDFAKFDLNVVYDSNNSYSKLNQIEKETEVLLLDNNQKVVIFGRPFMNRKMRDGYTREVKERSNTISCNLKHEDLGCSCCP